MKPGGDYSLEIPSSLSLKKHFIRVIEEQLTLDLELEHKKKAAEGEHTGTLTSIIKKKRRNVLKEIKVADIKFTYRNYKLINAMKKRGANIISQKWEKVEKSEKEI